MMSQEEYRSLCHMATAFVAARQAGTRGHNRGRHGAPPPSALSASSAPSSKPQLDFPCALCGKAFASYQALGGHMASHRKPAATRNGIVMPPSPSFALFREDEAASVAAPSSSAVPGGGGRHVCTVCRRGFASGQALGGHKRFHYLHGPFLSASLPGATAGSIVRGFDFDLNLAPPAAGDCTFQHETQGRGSGEAEP